MTFKYSPLPLRITFGYSEARKKKTARQTKSLRKKEREKGVTVQAQIPSTVLPRDVTNALFVWFCFGFFFFLRSEGA